mmetsp:Transcript_22323/g.72137  ORF Transcript_22323/g.72137 Transcript_22323/m.72137 type:complete len:258 (-) Transcript_22323:150-923(-)
MVPILRQRAVNSFRERVFEPSVSASRKMSAASLLLTSTCKSRRAGCSSLRLKKPVLFLSCLVKIRLIAASDKAGRGAASTVLGSGKPASLRHSAVTSRSERLPEWSESNSFNTACVLLSVMSMPSSLSTVFSSFRSRVPERFLSCLANVRPIDSSETGAATTGMVSTTLRARPDRDLLASTLADLASFAALLLEALTGLLTFFLGFGVSCTSPIESRSAAFVKPLESPRSSAKDGRGSYSQAVDHSSPFASISAIFS